MQKIECIQKEIDNAISIEEVESLRVFYLGKKGLVTQEFSSLKACKDIAEKKNLGAKLNHLRVQVLNAIESKKSALFQKAKQEKLSKEKIDITLPVRSSCYGKLHPISESLERAVEIFSNLGFESVSGDDIDDEFHVFDALNTPSHHPAREMQDSFYLSNGLMLRPHTSSVQVHVMKDSKPPFKIIAPGAVYRRDSDATHTPMFHQIEGLYIDTDVNMSHLKFCINYFIKEFFGKVNSRFRPSFFPFTEPSAEVDIQFSDGKWIEVLGCGMVHRNVLRNVGVDSSRYQGFAFGIGVERLTMLKQNVSDIRFLFENNLAWLGAYGLSAFSR